MKQATLLLILFCCAFLLGCQQAGMVSDETDRDRRIANINDTDDRQFVDDWDEFWLQDANLKLTEWQIYVGE